MERYHVFQIKDHYFWTDAAPNYTTNEERQAAKAKPEPQAAKPAAKPRYRSWKVREADSSATMTT